MSDTAREEVTADVLPMLPPEVRRQQELAAELELYSDGRIWEHDVVVREIVHHGSMFLHHVYEVGRRLIWTKEVLEASQGRGAFGRWCKEYLSFDRSTATRYMQFTRGFIDHPELLEPLGAAGFKRALLLTQIPDDMLQEVLAEGKVAEVPLGELGDIPYVDLKRRLKAEVKRREATEAALDESIKDHERLQADYSTLEKRVARISGSLGPARKAESMEALREVKTLIEGVMHAVATKLDPIAATHTDNDPEVQAHTEAILEWQRTWLDYEIARLMEIAGLGVTGAQLMEPLQRERPLATIYPIPEHRKLPGFGEEV